MNLPGDERRKRPHARRHALPAPGDCRGPFTPTRSRSDRSAHCYGPLFGCRVSRAFKMAEVTCLANTLEPSGVKWLLTGIWI